MTEFGFGRDQPLTGLDDAAPRRDSAVASANHLAVAKNSAYDRRASKGDQNFWDETARASEARLWRVLWVWS
jgi:hypothetical protein